MIGSAPTRPFHFTPNQVGPRVLASPFDQLTQVGRDEPHRVTGGPGQVEQRVEQTVRLLGSGVDHPRQEVSWAKNLGGNGECFACS
ncbi:hypothetical protein Q0M94_24645 (plasmid) [Deinococcus radiomollis]|uniref:hypothetical protein n=1 Tax=Deinococcus radiomollis TaxID=468916 RepID=UPI0038924E48